MVLMLPSIPPHESCRVRGSSAIIGALVICTHEQVQAEKRERERSPALGARDRRYCCRLLLHIFYTLRSRPRGIRRS